MKLLTSSIMSLALMLPALADDRSGNPISTRTAMHATNLQTVSPALETYRNSVILGDLWKRPDLSLRDRSIVTLAILIARHQPHELKHHLEMAFDNGVSAKEISEIITHLAFYSGWGNATAAIAVAKDVFAERKVDLDQLPAASPKRLPLDEAVEAKRAASVQESTGQVSEGLVKFTSDLLFRDLWLRPDLAPRDRSLVTVSALIASSQFAQITFHLNKAMDNGLTKAQASEVIAHAAFYAGWPNAFSAVPVFKAVFEKRQ